MKAQNKPIITNSNIRDFIMVFSFPLIFIALSILEGWFDVILRKMILYLFILLAYEYLTSIIFLNYYKFYEDYVERYYPTRMGKWRLRRIDYKNITLVKYHGDTHGGSMVGIYTSKKKQLLVPSNSFTVISYKKARKTLLFLQSKGVPIVIKSIDEKEQRILD